MKIQEIHIAYKVFDARSELDAIDAGLLLSAEEATRDAHSPYSKFSVGASAILSDGATIKGSNQENASFPAGICAERVLLSAASAVYPSLTVMTMAITYRGLGIDSSHPVAPCGICRQTLVEYEERFGHPIRLILAGISGPVYVFESAASLLPCRFSGSELPDAKKL